MKSPKLILPIFVFALIVAMVSFSARAQEEKPLIQEFLDDVTTLLLGVEVTTEADGNDMKVTSTEISGETVTLGDSKVTVTDTTTTIANDVTVTGNANIQGIVTLGDSKLVVTEAQTAINNQLCLDGECVSEWPIQILSQNQNSTTYVIDKNVKVEGGIDAEQITTTYADIQYMNLPNNFILPYYYSVGAEENSTSTRMTPVRDSLCFLTRVEDHKGDHAKICKIEQSDGFHTLTARYATCQAACITNSLEGKDGCKSFGGTPRGIDGSDVTNSGTYVFCEFQGSACPQNWEQYQEWFSTEEKRCHIQEYGCSGSECTALGYPLRNQDPFAIASNGIADASHPSCLNANRRFDCSIDENNPYICNPPVTSAGCTQKK